MRRLRLVLLALLSCPTPALADPPVEHVVIIVVDGLRPDAIGRAPAPNLQALVSASAYSDAARAVERPETLASHMTMVTGLPASVHGVTWNDDRDQPYSGDTLFTRVHAAGRRTALYYGKSKLVMLAPRGSADRVWGPGRNKTHRERAKAAALAARFAGDFPRDRPALVLLNLLEADAAGHNHGWMTPEYFAAIGVVDVALGSILRTIDGSGRAGRTAVLMTADHGGEGDNHGIGRGESSWLIPFACRVPGVPPQRVAAPVTLLDLAPTVLALLGLPAMPAQGRVIGACLPRPSP